MKVLALLLVLLTAGCLQNEETEIRIMRDKGDPAVFVMELSNFYSGETESAKIREDFDELIRNWRSEESVKQAASDGYQIKGRELFLRDGKIVLRLTAILQTLRSDGDLQVNDSSITWTLNDETIVETNGKVSDTNPKQIVWSKDATEIRVKFREELRESFKLSQPQMLQMLQTYFAAQEK